MAYGQINYQEKVGNGPYSIAQIGCLVTAFCNLAERFNVSVDPPTLNNLFIEYNDYLADPADGAGVKDDLSWNSITSAESGIVVTATGGAGWPDTNNAIVKFHYQSISHPTLSNGQPNMIDHFCLVADAAAHTIVDSWDGNTKSTGAYGEPVAWASYGGPVVQAVPAAAAAPAVPTTYEVVKAIPGYIHANDAANGLNQANIVQPGNYATFNEADGMINVTTKAGEPGSWINPADNVAGPAKPANIEFTKLDNPLNLVTNKQPTDKWNLGFDNDTDASSVEQLNQGVAFTAYGKGQRTDGDRPCYYMSEEDFGDADTSGIPVNNFGINTVDLSPAPAPSQPAAPAPPAPAATPAAAPLEGDKVPVTVLPAAWQSTFQAFPAPQEFVAKRNTLVADLNLASGNPAQQLVAGQPVLVRGKFTCDGVQYYRTDKSTTEGKWYGIRVTDLAKPSEGLLAKVASAAGTLERILHKNKKG